MTLSLYTDHLQLQAFSTGLKILCLQISERQFQISQSYSRLLGFLSIFLAFLTNDNLTFGHLMEFWDGFLIICNGGRSFRSHIITHAHDFRILITVMTFQWISYIYLQMGQFTSHLVVDFSYMVSSNYLGILIYHSNIISLCSWASDVIYIWLSRFLWYHGIFTSNYFLPISGLLCIQVMDS